ncbi:Uncharacterized protein LW93_1486 [Fusarium fujikuroi]|nr:Uncharacterized protein LW93_1486 [Fusarium fujikuroi]
MNKGFGGYATRMVDAGLGFATGWNYFFKYIIATPTNLTAAGLVIQFWRPDLNVAIWITIFGVTIVTVNILHVNTFGETEFWLGFAKVLIMTALIITTFVVAMGGGPNHDRSSFRYWQNPGAFAEYLLEGPKGRFLGFWACCCQACFGFTGTEVVGMTFGETPNPRKNVPRAAKQTFWRIACFYILGVLVLGMAVSYDNEQLIGATKQKTSGAASPFVVTVTLGGVPIFADIINGCLLVFTLSAASSVYDAFIPHFKPEVFVLKYLGTAFFVFNFVWWKVSKKTTWWSASDVDLSTGRREWEETERPEEVHWEGGLWKNVLRKFKP